MHSFDHTNPCSAAYYFNTPMITIEITCATIKKQVVLSYRLAENSTVKTAILASNIGEHFPCIDLTRQKVGIFGKIVDLDQLLSNKDRIEIYWPLRIDPKKARKLREAKKLTAS